MHVRTDGTGEANVFGSLESGGTWKSRVRVVWGRECGRALYHFGVLYHNVVMEDMETDRGLAGSVDEQREIHPLWRVPSKQKEGVSSEFPLHVISSNLSSKSSQPCQQHERGGRLVRVHPFPRPAECAHFHYEYVALTSLQLSLVEDEGGGGPRGHLGGVRSVDEEKRLHRGVSTASQEERREQVVFVVVVCKGRSWVVERNMDDFQELDSRLHSCIYKRHYSKLPKLRTSVQTSTAVLSAYLSRLSQLADDSLNCASVLNWFELDNYGGRLADEASCVNIPAILAARAVQSYQATAPDELSLQVGDLVSIIDRPAEGEPGWWRGKLRFEVGFFPGECVEPIEEGSPRSVPGPLVVRPVYRSKVALLLRGFFGVRPPRSTLRRRGILKERLFGCDLGEHLMNSGEKVPRVIVCCCEFLEKVGLVDGIYRHSGSSSNLQRLRHEFDSEMNPNLASEPYSLDIHCVSSLCKLYFRELPNPLLTYPLYHYFTEAVAAGSEEDQLRQTKVAIEQLPPPHYRTFCYLLSHLCFMASQSNLTSMDARNLAIVWAPNLLRSREVESGVIGSRAFFEVRAQAAVLEFIITHAHRLINLNSSHQTVQPRPKSLGGASSTKLLSLAEAQALNCQVRVSDEPGGDAEESRETDRDGVNQSEKLHQRALRRNAVGGGGGGPTGSTGEVKGPATARGGWRSFFQLTKGTGAVRRRLQRQSTSPEGGLGWRSRSEESLSAFASKHVPPSRPPRPRSSDDLQPMLPEARSSPHSPFRASKFKTPDIANLLGSRSRERRSDGTVLEDMFVFVSPSQPPVPSLSRSPPSEAPPPYSPPRSPSLPAISPPTTLQSTSEESQHLSFQTSSSCPPCLPPQNSGIQPKQFNSDKHSALPPQSRSSRGASTNSKESIFAVTSTYSLVTNQEVVPVILAPVGLPQRNPVNAQHHPRPSVLRPKTAYFHNGKVHYRSSLEPVHTSHPKLSSGSSSYHVRTHSDPDRAAINASNHRNDMAGGVVRCNNRSTMRPMESPPDVLPDLAFHFHNSARQLHSGHTQEKAGSPSRLPEQRAYRLQGPSRFHEPSPSLLKTGCSTSRTTPTTFSTPTVHASRQDVHGVQGVVGVGGRFFWREGAGDPTLTRHQTYDVERPVEMRQVPLRHVAPPPNSHPHREFSSTDLDWQETEGVGGLESKLVVPHKYSSNLLRSDL